MGRYTILIFQLFWFQVKVTKRTSSFSAPGIHTNKISVKCETIFSEHSRKRLVNRDFIFIIDPGVGKTSSSAVIAVVGNLKLKRLNTKSKRIGLFHIYLFDSPNLSILEEYALRFFSALGIHFLRVVWCDGPLLIHI